MVGGGFRSDYDGAQDYDLLLRICALSSRVHHIPRVLYHWRSIPGSTASSFNAKTWANEAGLRAVQDLADRSGLDCSFGIGPNPGTYLPNFSIHGTPMVSIIVPFRDRARLLDQCLEHALGKTSWENLEIIAINNGSEETETRQIIDKWKLSDAPVPADRRGRAGPQILPPPSPAPGWMLRKCPTKTPETGCRPVNVKSRKTQPACPSTGSNPFRPGNPAGGCRALGILSHKRSNLRRRSSSSKSSKLVLE